MGVRKFVGMLNCSRCGQFFPSVTGLQVGPDVWVCSAECQVRDLAEIDEIFFQQLLRDVGDEVLPYLKKSGRF